VRVTRNTEALAWVIEFLNLPVERVDVDAEPDVTQFLARHVPPGGDGTETQRAKRIQEKWSRLLHPLIEPKPDAQALRESFYIGIAVYVGLIRTQQERITALEHMGRSDAEVEALRQQLDQLQTDKAHMEQHVKLDDAAILRPPVRTDLRGAVCVTQEEALKQIVAKLNQWSLNRSIHPTWRLSPDVKSETRTRFTRRAWHLEGKPCSVEQRIAPGKILTTASEPGPVVGLEDVLCVHLARILETGELAGLRRCQLPRCRHVFFAHRTDKTHCRPEHQREHDGKSRNGVRVRKSRKKNKAELKKYALAILPTLSVQMVRAWVNREVLPERAIDAVDEMLEQLQDGRSPAQVWRQSNPRTRGLFKKLQKARAV
jgi:hypothetical protein